jgi:hypothetical protein
MFSLKNLSIKSGLFFIQFKKKIEVLMKMKLLTYNY